MLICIFVVFYCWALYCTAPAGVGYFQSWIDTNQLSRFSQIVLIITGAITLLQRTYCTQKSISRTKFNPRQFMSFIPATSLDETFVYLLAFLVFLANLKLLKLMRFNHRIYLFTKTLSKAALPLFSFLVVFLVFHTAYSLLSVVPSMEAC